MTLPTSRNTTYAASSPILSADLNALQDMIIGRKFPAADFPFGGTAFQLQTGTAQVGAAADNWTFSAVSQLIANLSRSFGVGTRLNSLKFAYNRGGAGNVTLSLYKRNIVTNAARVTIATTTINAGTGWTTTTLSPVYVTEADMSVWLEVQCDNVANVFGGCIVNADRL